MPAALTSVESPAKARSREFNVSALAASTSSSSRSPSLRLARARRRWCSPPTLLARLTSAPGRFIGVDRQPLGHPIGSVQPRPTPSGRGSTARCHQPDATREPRQLCSTFDSYRGWTGSAIVQRGSALGVPFVVQQYERFGEFIPDRQRHGNRDCQREAEGHAAALSHLSSS